MYKSAYGKAPKQKDKDGHCITRCKQGRRHAVAIGQNWGDISTPIIGVDMSPLWGGYVTLVLVHPDVLFTCLVGTGA